MIGKKVNLSNVGRDLSMALVTETISSPCNMYTVNNLKDNVRAPRMMPPFEINRNVNRHNFVDSIIELK